MGQDDGLLIVPAKIRFDGTSNVQKVPQMYIPQRSAETSENLEESWYHILTGITDKSETACQILNR